MNTPATAYLGLGSNVGNKEENLRAAVDALDAHLCLRVLQASPVYKTAPRYVEDQDWFLNAVVKVETLLEPDALLEALKPLEQQLGRVARERYGPREIDIDILLYPGRRVDRAGLTIPHPRLAERSFVLRPLVDIGADVPIDGSDLTPRTLLKALDADAGVEPLAIDPLRPRTGTWHDRLTRTAEQTERFGALLGGACAGGEVFALCGDLGAGKTCMARGFAHGLRIFQPVQSPTFTLCRTYPEGRLTLYHWDFYRLTDPEEVETAGFEDTIDDPGGIVVVEWADKFPEFWMFPHTKIWLSVVDDDSRRLAVRFPEAGNVGLPTTPIPGDHRQSVGERIMGKDRE